MEAETIPGSSKTEIPAFRACGDVQDSVYRASGNGCWRGCMAAIDGNVISSDLEFEVRRIVTVVSQKSSRQPFSGERRADDGGERPPFSRVHAPNDAPHLLYTEMKTTGAILLANGENHRVFRF